MKEPIEMSKEELSRWRRLDNMMRELTPTSLSLSFAVDEYSAGHAAGKKYIIQIVRDFIDDLDIYRREHE